ncbi:MAG: DMT family transporter [Lachnospiraceae bacterium]|nr:DMT family transporter [Lachnospiraceae bacterium]MCI9282602.1 DMT family transporter [Lachnospiraceae bacterium]
MGYLYLLCVALMFSFGGTCVKLISPHFGPAYITFFRFAVGVCFLLLLKVAKRQRFQKDFFSAVRLLTGWLLFGATAKWVAYLTENYALSHGPSYGNIVTQPAQTVFLTLSSVLLFKEKLPPKKLFCILLCMAGVLCISWNGRPLEVFFQENILLTGLFILSGFCAGCHVLSQKMIADQMDIIDSNLSIFAVSAILAFIPLVPGMTGGDLAGVRPDLGCIAGILIFGFITGIGFYLNARAILLVPFYMVPVIQSTMAIFAILWGVLFFHEKISVYIVGGTVMFITGLIGLQLKEKIRKKENAK